MNLYCFSLAFDRADLCLREHYALDAHERGRLRQQFLTAGATEALTLCTCNRTEIYYALPQSSDLDSAALLGDFKGQPPQALRDAGVLYRNEQAAEHLFALACGLRSLIIGETEILGQLKTAYANAVAADTVDKTLNRVFQRAFALAKQIRTGTSLGRFRVSVAGTAVERLRTRLGANFQNSMFIVWGTGTVGAAVVRGLEGAGARPGIILSRRPETAGALFPHWRICSSEELPGLMPNCDALLCATGAPHALVYPYHLERRRPHLLLADLAVPRNIAPEAGTLPGVELFTVDDLADTSGIYNHNDAAATDAGGKPDNAQEAQSLAPRVREEALRFWRCARAGSQERCIARWRQEAHHWLAQELQEFDQEWPELPAPLRERYHRFARSLMHRMLHLPSDALKRAVRENLPCAEFFADDEAAR